jgi:4-amino-4-deoxy-L-arabinose transferase-like glycosyltransferase
MTPAAMPAWSRWLLLLLLALSALLQATVASRTQVTSPLRVDALDYFSYAINLREHGVYSLQRGWYQASKRDPVPDSVRPPGYPLLLLSLDPQVSWNWLRRLAYIQGLMAVFSVWLVHRVGRSFLSEPMALLAASLTALCPALVVLATYVLSEVFFMLVLLAAMLASIAAMRRSSDWKPALGAGLLWGAASLVRPTAQFLPVLFLALALALPRLSRFRRASAVCLLGFSLAMAPWMLRNLLLPPQPPGQSLMVKALAHGSYPDFEYAGEAESYGYPYRSDPDGEDRIRDLPHALHYIARDFRARPGHMLRWYLLSKPVVFLSWSDPQAMDIFIYTVCKSPYLEAGWLRLSWQLMWLAHWPLVLLGVGGMLAALMGHRQLHLAPEQADAAALVALVLGYAIAFHMLVAPFPRYNLPFRPLLFVLAALCLQSVWRAFRASRRPDGSGSTSALSDEVTHLVS